MATYRVSTFVAAPPERVFEAWTDPDRFIEWIGGVTRVTGRVGSAGQAGSSYTVWFGLMASPTEVIEAERPRHIRSTFGNAILKGESDVTFTPEGAGTRIQQVFETRGLVASVVGRVFAMGSYRGSFRGELETFRAMVERDSPGAGGPQAEGR